MAQLLTPEYTSFTLDNIGRLLCNTLQEAKDSADGLTAPGRPASLILADLPTTRW